MYFPSALEPIEMVEFVGDRDCLSSPIVITKS